MSKTATCTEGASKPPFWRRSLAWLMLLGPLFFLSYGFSNQLAAAKAVLATEETAAIGPAYVRRLEEIGLVAAMRQFAGFSGLMDNPRLFSVYPALATDLFKTLYSLDTAVAPPLRQGLWHTLRQNTSLPSNSMVAFMPLFP